MTIAAVILNHNKPENADKLYEQLDGVFDRVELWDSGSDSDKIPINLTEAFDNIYWAGAWNEIMSRYSDYDAVWMLGCDVTLQSEPEAYLAAIRASGDFGCWSPCVSGRAHPFMKAENYSHDQPKSVRNVEGMAMAVSGKLMREVGKLVEGGTIGFGQDYWLCYRARKLGLLNIIDGGVSIYHPAEIGYDEMFAHDQMEAVFGELYGEDFRETIFEYDERYEGNLVNQGSDMITIVTVDNGWGVDEFVDIVSKFPDTDKVILQKGASSLAHLQHQGIRVIPYANEGDVDALIKDADIALFSKVGPANEKEYRRILDAGVPTVVNVSHSQGSVEHEKDGLEYGNKTWAIHWVETLINQPDYRASIKQARASVPEREEKAPEAPPEPQNVTVQEPDAPERDAPMVTVITPTYKRDLKIVRRSIDCMKLQQFQDWEQLVCSNGMDEKDVRELIVGMDEPRVGYHWCEAPEGDYGNYARKAMLKAARGKYVAFLDDDNIILPEFLSVMVASLEESGADYAVCRIMHFGPLNEEVLGKPPIVLTGIPVELYNIDPLQFLVRRTVMQELGWDTDVGYLSDGVTLEKLNGRSAVEVPLVLGVHV